MAGRCIEDAIHEKLTGEAQQNALDFFTFMQANGFSLEHFDLGHMEGWSPSFGGCVLIPDAEKGVAVYIGLDAAFEDDAPVEDAFREAIYKHVCVCPSDHCQPPYCQKSDDHPASHNRWRLLGRAFESTCHSPLAFENPDAETYENMKKLLLLIK